MEIVVMQRCGIGSQNERLQLVAGLRVRAAALLLVVSGCASPCGLGYAEGDVRIDSSADAEAARELRCVYGNLRVRPVGGVGGVHMPNLEKVGGAVSLALSDDLAEISLPNLVEVGQTLSITGDGGVSQIDLPRLEVVHGFLNVYHTEQLSAVRFPALRECGILTADHNEALVAAEFPSLSRVTSGRVTVGFNPKLERLTLPRLEEVAGPMAIDLNDELVQLDVGSLRFAEQVRVSMNPKLPTCQVEAQLVNVDAAVGVFVGRNDDDPERCTGD